MSGENIENMTKSNNNFAPTFVNHHALSDLSFNGHCLRNNNIYISKKVINLYISYILNPWLINLNTDFTLKDCLFGSVKLTKNADLNKHKYSGYSIGFDPRSKFSFTHRSLRKNAIIFGADMGSSMRIDNKNKDMLIRGEGQTQRLDDTTIIAEAKHLFNFT